jgi:hypothetical protein
VESVFSYPGSFGKSRQLVEAIRHKREPLVHVLQTQSQFLIRTHNETLSVVAMRVSNAHVRSRAET